MKTQTDLDLTTDFDGAQQLPTKDTLVFSPKDRKRASSTHSKQKTKASPETQEALSLQKNPKQPYMKIKFLKPICKFTAKGIREQCYRDVTIGPGQTKKIYDPVLQGAILERMDNFYVPGKIYDLPANLAKELLKQGNKITYIDNSKAHSVEEIVPRTDTLDPRLRNFRPVAIEVCANAENDRVRKTA